MNAMVELMSGDDEADGAKFHAECAALVPLEPGEWFRPCRGRRCDRGPCLVDGPFQAEIKEMR